MTINVNPTPGTQKYVIACGDSITASGGGWRTYFQVIARSANKRIMWMGTQSSGQPSIQYPLHMAFSGYWIDAIATQLAAFTPPNTPDVVFTHVGTNDLLYANNFGGTAGTLATMNARHTTFIDAIFARWTSVIIVCCKIGNFYGIYGSGATDVAPPTPSGDLPARQVTAGFNTYIGNLPGSHAKGAQIKVCDIPAAMNDTSYLHDGLHPTAPNGLTLTARALWNTSLAYLG